jgi:hypothetical protein
MLFADRLLRQNAKKRGQKNSVFSILFFPLETDTPTLYDNN